MVKFATASPFCVYRSSGSAVRLPTTVMTVSPATGYSALAVAVAEALAALRAARASSRCFWAATCAMPSSARRTFVRSTASERPS